MFEIVLSKLSYARLAISNPRHADANLFRQILSSKIATMTTRSQRPEAHQRFLEVASPAQCDRLKARTTADDSQKPVDEQEPFSSERQDLSKNHTAPYYPWEQYSAIKKKKRKLGTERPLLVASECIHGNTFIPSVKTCSSHSPLGSGSSHHVSKKSFKRWTNKWFLSLKTAEFDLQYRHAEDPYTFSSPKLSKLWVSLKSEGDYAPPTARCICFMSRSIHSATELNSPRRH